MTIVGIIWKIRIFRKIIIKCYNYPVVIADCYCCSSSQCAYFLTFSLRCKKPSSYMIVWCIPNCSTAFTYISRTERKLCARCKVGYSNILYTCIAFVCNNVHTHSTRILYIRYIRVYIIIMQTQRRREREWERDGWMDSEKPWELAAGVYNIFTRIYRYNNNVIYILYYTPLRPYFLSVTIEGRRWTRIPSIIIIL